MTREELLLKAKIPGPETGIEIRHTICDICTPGPQCGIDAYIKDGKVIKVEGTKGFPSNNGKLCTKGAANRQYIYRSDRIHTPMRRTGERGSGQFEPVSWEEAYQEAAEKLLRIKREHGAQSVAFMCGYPKWYRPFLRRLAYSYGSPNYTTESSACNRAEVMSQKSIFGCVTGMDMAHAKLFVAWGSNPFINMFPMGRGLNAFKAGGGKIIVIDPRNTQAAQKLADLYMRPKLGTDGYLAHTIANLIIRNGWTDEDYIARYVHGYTPYREYVSAFTPEEAERITGVPEADICKAAEMIGTIKPAIIRPSNAITHRLNGYNNHRAIYSLAVITGQFDRPGTLKPETDTFCHSDGGFKSLEDSFSKATRPQTDFPPIGSERFPLFQEMVDEGQGMDFIRHASTATPYPLYGAVLFGLNHRMYPESERFLKVLDGMEFVLATDIFWTDTCRHADLVLPVSTSFERSEVKCYAGKFINYTRPAIAPVWENRDDVRVITELANALELEDPLLRSGYDACVRYMLAPGGIEDWDAMREHDGPVLIPNARAYQWGSTLKNGANTPTGKLELYSEVVAKYQDRGLNPLPVYLDSDDPADVQDYPFTLCSGARLPNAIHTRLHGCSWSRALRKKASVDINPEDARRLDIQQGDRVALETPVARIELAANLTEVANVGEVHLYHGYREANVNSLISIDHLDPYTGFPGYKQLRCRIVKL